MLTENIAVITSDEARERLVSPAPVLISEQEVVLGTAVALRARPIPRRRWFEAISVLRTAMRRSDRAVAVMARRTPWILRGMARLAPATSRR